MSLPSASALSILEPRRPALRLCSAVVLAVLLAPAAGLAKTPVLIDTDVGSDIDDAFALGLALASPELEVRGITTAGKDAVDRAWILCRFLTAVGRRSVPVAWGRDPQPKNGIDGQIQYRRHPAPLYNRTSKPVRESAVEFLYRQLKADPGKITLIGLGPLTNLARLLREHPECKPWIRRIILMGGSVRAGYSGKPPVEAEWNIKSDIPAAQAVFTSGVPLIVAPLDGTATVKLEEPLRKKLFASCTPLTMQVQSLYQLWNHPTPVLFDPVAVSLAFTDKFCTMEDLHLTVDDGGFTRIGKRKPNARVATAVKGQEFLDWLVGRLATGKAVLPAPPGNRTTLIDQGGRPNRVHCFEDYETDIEKRWWMSGRAETTKAPPGSKRACRGVLTQDFDDLQGDTKTMYTAVVFNPVPGPPMGKHPRLSFRYFLEGTDTLRVQIYSLSKGYHRYLSLTGLPQGKWQSAAVDMTVARRPDGSGGPLSENERIDDVQFYVDPRAGLLIDDMVLYDAAPAEEKHPFPRSIQYTGWFDTGKQGKEWPGVFDIVEKGYFWKAAQSRENPAAHTPWINLHLRGPRPLGKSAELFFRYRLHGAASLQAALLDSRTNKKTIVPLKDLKTSVWAETTASLGGAGGWVDQLQFLLPAGAELQIDDVLLYEPR